MFELRTLRVEDEKSFCAAINEFEIHNPDFGFAFRFNDQTPFRDYVDLVNGWSKGINVAPFVPNTFLIGVENGKIVGRVSLRHELNDFLLREGGHLGYGVVPSERRKGYAKKMIAGALPFAKSLGLTKILLTCDDDNEGSWRAIEANRGVLEGKRFESEMRVALRRYWIDLD